MAFGLAVGGSDERYWLAGRNVDFGYNGSVVVDDTDTVQIVAVGKRFEAVFELVAPMVDTGYAAAYYVVAPRTRRDWWKSCCSVRTPCTQPYWS